MGRFGVTFFAAKPALPFVDNDASPASFVIDDITRFQAVKSSGPLSRRKAYSGKEIGVIAGS